MTEIRLAGIERESVVDGPGIRMVIFAQGCPHNCPGCHNPDTHDPGGGYTDTVENLIREMESVSHQIDGITLSGGEPFFQAEAMAVLAEKVKELGLNLIIYSGYTFEQLLQLGERRKAVKKLLEQADILVDGPYLQAERDLSLKYRGSRNQRLIDVPAALAENRPVSL